LIVSFTFDILYLAGVVLLKVKSFPICHSPSTNISASRHSFHLKTQSNSGQNNKFPTTSLWCVDTRRSLGDANFFAALPFALHFGMVCAALLPVRVFLNIFFI